MLKTLPRRKRQTILTAASTLALVGLAALGMLMASRPEAAYRPGEEAEGITSTLDRPLPPGFRPAVFIDVAEQAGIDFRHFSGKRTSQLPEDMGSGAAWGDYDADGWPDLYITNLAGPLTLSPEEVRRSPAHSRLYRNNRDGTFTDVSVDAGVDFRGFANGAAWGDADNDGAADLVLTTFGGLVLYRNLGGGRFSDITQESGLGEFDGFWVGASWADYDRDGLLDLYVTGYVQYEQPDRRATSRQYDVENPASINPSSFKPERNLLFRNVGGSRFEEVGLKSGVSNPEGRSLSAAWADLDNDGWTDLYVANDVSDNVLYRNLGDGTFADVSHPARVADYRGAMGIAVGDWDGDADPDLFVTHWIAQENAFYSNQSSDTGGQLRFMDEADLHGLGQVSLDYIGWATSFLDVDNDGRLDLFVANGSTLQQSEDPTLLGVMTSQLFWNGGPSEGFFDVSPVSGPYFGERHVARGAAVADFDRDGDLDIAVVHHGGRAALLRNDTPAENNWVSVTLEGRPEMGSPHRTARQAVGARLRLVAGGHVQTRQIGAQSSYASQNALTEHFGLGRHAGVDSLVVDWPSGLRQVSTNIPAGQHVRIVESELLP